MAVTTQPTFIQRMAPWAVALACAVLAVALRPWISEYIGAQTAYYLAVPAVALSAAYGGWWPGVTTAVLCIAGVGASIELGLMPGSHFGQRTVAFVIAALAICWFAERLHRARRQAREHAERSDQLLAELRSSREHLQLHVDNSEQLVWLKDGQGRYVFANRAACAAANVDCEEMIGKTDADVLRPERAAVAAAAEREVRHTMAPVTQDSVQIGDRVFRVVRFPVALPDGQVGIGATGLDITELTASQARLTQLLAAAQERERVLQSVLDHVPEGITVAMGEQARIVLVSRHGAELMQGPVAGLTDIDAITVDPAATDIAPDDTAARARLPIARACRGEVIKNEEVRVQRADGRWIPLLCDAGPIVDGQGAPVGGVLAWRDISALKQTERAYRQAMDTLDLLLSQTPLAVVMFDRNFTVTRWTGQAENMFGWRADEAVGRHFDALSLVHPDDADKVQRTARRLLEQRVSVVSFNRNVSKHGETIWCEWYNSVMLDEHGEMAAVLSLVLDVTEREIGERALRDADRKKDEFLATLAHELRNPLAPVRSAATVLSMGTAAPAQMRWAAGVIERQVGHMSRLLDDLLDVSRLTHNRLELKRARHNIQQIVGEAAEQSGPGLREADQHLVVEAPPPPLWVWGDRARLVQVFTNLLNNSAKYADGAGTVTVRISGHDGRAQVEVTDQGIGIPPASQGQVFDLFARTDTRAHRQRGGLGIGLSLVKSIVEMHGGTVRAYSAGLGQGTQMTVWLPLCAAPETTTEVSLAAPARARGGAAPTAGHAQRVLVIDDNQDGALSLAQLLEQLGYVCETAFTGQGGVAAAASLRPDIVVLDIGLPDMSGYDAARALRNGPGGADLFLVALTGYGRAEDRAQALQAGCDAHLVKPVDVDALMQVLQRRTEGARLPA